MAYRYIHGLSIFVFFFTNSLFLLVLYVYCSSTHVLPINLILSNLEGFVLSFPNSLFVYYGFNLYTLSVTTYFNPELFNLAAGIVRLQTKGHGVCFLFGAV
jgi:hypothetical protein